MTYTLKLYRDRPGSWSYTLANSVGGSTSMGNWRSKSAILNVLAIRGYDPASITAVETYHWTGTNWRRIGGAS